MSSRLLRLVAEVLEVPLDEVTARTGPATAAQWISLKHIQIIAAIEDAYGVSLTPKEIRSVKSVADLQHMLAQRNIAE